MNKLGEMIAEIAERYLVPDTQYGGFRHPEGKALSITAAEGKHLFDLIKKHNLRVGYEIATGTGYSSLWLASALDRLVTIDSYIEDRVGVAPSAAEEYISNPDAAAYRTTGAMHKELGTSPDIRIGVSPNDVCHIVAAFAPGQGGLTIDFVFIDGNHYGDHPEQDLLAIHGYTTPKCVLAWHDWGCRSVQRGIGYAVSTLGFDLGYSFERLWV